MAYEKPINGHANGRLAFMKQFLRHPLQVASIIPSSRSLERQVVAAAEVASARVVVELGPGTGGVTRALLRAMPRIAKLLSIEINSHFHALVNRIDDDRLITHLGSASELEAILAVHGLDAPNAIVSGIPFSTMSPTDGTRILDAVSSLLASSGRFVAYQFSNRVAALCQPLMGPAQTTTVLFNIPPTRIFQWDKRAE